jgi:hypothetical protein
VDITNADHILKSHGRNWDKPPRIEMAKDYDASLAPNVADITVDADPPLPIAESMGETLWQSKYVTNVEAVRDNGVCDHHDQSITSRVVSSRR